MPAWHAAELDRRLATHRRGESGAQPADEALDAIDAELRRRGG